MFWLLSIVLKKWGVAGCTFSLENVEEEEEELSKRI
jgi:hypothetical protein